MTDSHLTPTEELIVEVLAARHRLGEPFWPIPHRHRKALDSLVSKGLVSYESAVTQGDYRAELTQAGRQEHMKADYVAPALDPNCRSFYLGPKTREFRVDCDRKAHGPKKKHRSSWYKLATSGGVVETVVKWTDAEAYGYASAIYGDQLRAADAAAETTTITGTEDGNELSA